MDREMEIWNMTCFDDGSWDNPAIWPICVECKNSRSQFCIPFIELSDTNCTEPPPRFPSGTWEWSGDYSYQTQISYTCGPYGKFESSNGELFKELISECLWNKTWSPPVLDPCKGNLLDS